MTLLKEDFSWTIDVNFKVNVSENDGVCKNYDNTMTNSTLITLEKKILSADWLKRSSGNTNTNFEHQCKLQEDIQSKYEDTLNNSECLHT